jgi:predicted dehydrogenase
MPAELRIGFAGAGWVAQKHVSVLQRNEDARLVAFASPGRSRAEALATTVGGGARAYNDALDMIDRESLDALYICVPPDAHGAIERAAIERRLPFFVEKPLAVDYEAAAQISRAVTEAGLITAVGYHWRYLDTTDRAKALLEGHPARMALGFWLGSTPPPAWWRRQDQSGGQMVEQTTHLFDLARYLVGEVASVYAAGSRTWRAAFPDLDVDDVSTATLTFAGGAVGTMSSTCLLRNGRRVGLHLFADEIAIEVGDREILIDRGDGPVVEPAGTDPFVPENRDFLDAVAGKPSRIRSPYHDALLTHRVTTLAAESARTGKLLTVAAG